MEKYKTGISTKLKRIWQGQTQGMFYFNDLSLDDGKQTSSDWERSTSRFYTELIELI